MKKILIIEDNQEVRENLAEILTLSDYEALKAENGKVGVEIATHQKPDLILCDVMMPELDGFGVLHILTKNPETANIPFIFLTAKTEKADIRRGMNLGADDYITKPFDDVELLEAVETRLRKSAKLNQDFPRDAKGIQAFINEARGYTNLLNLSHEQGMRTMKAKEPLFHEGSYPRQVYLVEKGRIKVFKSSDDGRELIVEVAGPGDFIGYLELLNDTPYTTSASALEDSEVYYIPREDFTNLLHQNRDVSARLIKMLAKNLAEQEENLVRIAYHSVRKRVAEALLHLDAKYQEEDGQSVAISMMRQDLAQIIGTAKETLIRTLSDFRDEGLIKIEESSIYLLNREKLENLPN
ncbi:MAG: response regulator [Saprospiraceae bacterium]|nr:response regulator [Saprospiraceae bacterium]